jgi:steroid 5-alpha reductase family enzyme
VISSPWTTLAIGAGAISLAMALLWALQVRIRDASHVDVGWTYGVGGTALLYTALADGGSGHRALIAALTAAWSARLGTYLLVNRVLGAREEDGRYRTLRAKWGEHANRRFFVFFQAQAAFVVIFSVPALLAAYHGGGGIEPLEWAGAAVALSGMAGEATADRQLARWRANPANKGKTARTGLWNTSRHPNYFFEWTTWIGFALIACAAPWGWLAFMTPAFLLVLLFFVTGIPATEAQALIGRGEDYRRYQREVSAFVPWFPKR